MSGVQSIIQTLILFIIILFTWIIGRVFILPNINVGIPALEPYPLWQGIYNAVWNVSLIILGFSSGIILVIYLIYFFFRYIFPARILFFPIRSRVMKTTPIKEFIDCGLFPMFDNLLSLWKSSTPFISKILGTINQIIGFLAKSVRYLVTRLASLFGLQPRTIDIDTGAINVGQPKPDSSSDGGVQEKLSSTTGLEVGTRSVSTPLTSFQEATSNPTPQFATKYEGEPVDADPDLNINERKYIEAEYQNCILKNYVSTEGENLSTLDNVSLQVKNTNAKIVCGIDKLNAYARIYQSMFNR